MWYHTRNGDRTQADIDLLEQGKEGMEETSAGREHQTLMQKNSRSEPERAFDCQIFAPVK